MQISSLSFQYSNLKHKSVNIDDFFDFTKNIVYNFKLSMKTLKIIGFLHLFCLGDKLDCSYH
jgi:hypothetical protein